MVYQFYCMVLFHSQMQRHMINHHHHLEKITHFFMQDESHEILNLKFIKFEINVDRGKLTFLLVNQGSQVRFSVSTSLSDETLSRGSVF